MNMLCRKALRSVSAFIGLLLFAAHVAAQSPPTATEAFNLRIKCKKMSDEKADGISEANGMLKWEIVTAWNTSKYDPISNRCYGRIYEHITKPSYRLDHEHDEVFDLQTDDLLAAANTENGKRLGVFLTQITKRLGSPLVGLMVVLQILAIKHGKLLRIT
jgi:hypothetical protein